MTFGERVQTLRKNNGLSQEKLANELRINRNYLSRIETDKSEPDLSVIINIAKFFNVDVANLMGIQDYKKSSEEKIKYIAKECSNLIDSDLDIIIRMISILKQEYIKKDI